jgi:hypothetical protein
MTKTKKRTPNKTLVLKALKAGKGVTRASAQKQFGVENLRATISDLRNNDGYTGIKTNIITQKGEKFVRYTM